ncbi:hypothetical protein [Aquabacter spiritensis]|uniref:Glycosyl transferase family 2 n=1 Tax=Aquabacter spiritensis TaxID=933073 RepID=A0A4R3M0E8_9HYPH|nr:hypothetical protein [Aquabacter spiritensis]TCT06183.1 hypothetical protein EDC64_103287 [Aquabacter spiritensis]
MTAPVPAGTPALRGDYLVSVGVVVLALSAPQIEALRVLAGQLAARYQFWEMVVVAPIGEEAAPALLGDLARIPNVRVLRVEAVDNFYRMRLAAASEAIGDVVLLTSLDELPLMNLPDLADRVYESDEVIVMVRGHQGALTHAFLGAIGRVIGYRIDPRDTLTAGFPRAWLSLTLPRPDADLLLRFERRTGTGRFRRAPVPPGVRVPRAPNSLGRRFRLLADLMTSAAPRVLRSVAALSLAVAVFAVVYGAYAVIVWMVKDDIAPGWLTTSALQAIIVGFLGITVAAISIGLVKLLDRIEGMLRYTIVDEVTNVDFFSKVTDLNVEIRAADAVGDESR